MNWRTTLWLSGTATLLLLIVLGIERPYRQSRTLASAPQRVLPGFLPDAVDALEVRAASNVVRVLRTNGVWVVDQPALPAADRPLVEGILQRLTQLRGPSVLSAAELRARPQAAREFGLNPPVASLAILDGPTRSEILLGSRSLTGNQVYFQIPGLAGIFATDAGLLDEVQRDASGWRDPVLIPLQQLDFDRLRVSSPSGTFSLVRGVTNGTWDIVEPRPARADATRVNLLLRQLEFLPVVRFFSVHETPTAEDAGLQPPRLVLSLARGTNEVFQLALGNLATNFAPATAPAASNLTAAPAAPLFAKRGNPAEVLGVPTETLDLLRISYKDLLDRRLLRFDRALVREIDIHGTEDFRLVRTAAEPGATNSHGVWRIQPGDQPADTEAVDRLLANLAVLEMIDVAKENVTEPDRASYGLAPPAGRITLRANPGEASSTLAQLEIGALRENLNFSRIPGDPAVYSVNPADIQALPTAAWQVRDRALWSFEAAKVTAVSVQHEAMQWTLRRTGTNDWAVPPGWRNEVNPFALEEALHRLGRVRALKWIGPGESRHLGLTNGPLLTLEFQASPSAAASNTPPPTVQVAFGKRSPAGNRYAASTLAAGGRMSFEIPGAIFEDLWREIGIADNAASAPR